MDNKTLTWPEHVQNVADILYSKERRIFVYEFDTDEPIILKGFKHIPEVINWLDTQNNVEVVCLSGEWEAGDLLSDLYHFDGHEINPGETWEDFKSDFSEQVEENRKDLEKWRREIAMEEGRLNGIQSYNDWMGY